MYVLQVHFDLQLWLLVAPGNADADLWAEHYRQSQTLSPAINANGDECVQDSAGSFEAGNTIKWLFIELEVALVSSTTLRRRCPSRRPCQVVDLKRKHEKGGDFSIAKHRCWAVKGVEICVVGGVRG